MSVKQIYEAIWAHAPLNVCDQCIADEVGSSVDTVEHATGAFGLTSEFKRYPGLCSRCGKERLVTRTAGAK